MCRKEGVFPIAEHDRMLQHMVQSVRNDNRVQHQIDADKGDRNPDRLLKPLQENRPQQRHHKQSDGNTMSLRQRMCERIFDNVGRCVCCRQRDRDHEVRCNEAEQAQDKEFPEP